MAANNCSISIKPAGREVCKFFQRGLCKFGASCHNSHEILSSSDDKKAKTKDSSVPICHHYKAGNCIFGDKCFYRHTTTTEESSINFNYNVKNGSIGQLCSYFETPYDCPNGDKCNYIHFDICEICEQACLIPGDEQQQSMHKEECMTAIETEMEHAFAVQRSSEKCCGICMEVVWEKEKENDRRFGILENCDHSFCLSCIRRWRELKSYENKVVKSCPECRVKSDFITPNRFWFKDLEDKKKIIEDYKAKLGKTKCKHFREGDGHCPFGNKCFYLHQNKDGTIAVLPDPTTHRRYNNSLLSSEANELYSNIISIDFDFSDEEFEENFAADGFDLLEFFRHNLLLDSDDDDDDTYDSDSSDI